MATSDPDIFAVGECTLTQHQVFGLVAPPDEMAGVLVTQLAGNKDATFSPSAVAIKLRGTGINLFSAGDFADGPDRQEIVLPPWLRQGQPARARHQRDHHEAARQGGAASHFLGGVLVASILAPPNATADTEMREMPTRLTEVAQAAIDRSPPAPRQ